MKLMGESDHRMSDDVPRVAIEFLLGIKSVHVA